MLPRAKARARLASALLAANLAAACTPGPSRAETTSSLVPLPARVTGANLRPVGDARRGYGSRTARRTMERLRALGVNTLGILLEARMENLSAREVVGPSRRELEAVRQGLLDAHALGLATVLVPHLYSNDGRWRGDLKLGEARAREAWWNSYGAFIHQAARLAQESGASALSVGVELKGLSNTNEDAARMRALTKDVRKVYKGVLTYSANWDEAEQVKFWDALDVAGVNGYYPLTPDPARGAERVARRLSALAASTRRPLLVLEAGYRSSPLSHVRPWEWPEQLEADVDDDAQAAAWAAVLTHWLPAEGVRGLLFWVVPTDPDDPASEARHGFNPLNKPAEEIIERAFRAAHRKVP